MPKLPEYGESYADFDAWWLGNYSHCDAVLRSIAAAAFMAARGYELGGKRLEVTSWKGPTNAE